MLAKNAFSLLWKVKPIYGGHELWNNPMPSKIFLCTSDIFLAFFVKSTTGESFGFYWNFCPSLPTV